MKESLENNRDDGEVESDMQAELIGSDIYDEVFKGDKAEVILGDIDREEIGSDRQEEIEINRYEEVFKSDRDEEEILGHIDKEEN